MDVSFSPPPASCPVCLDDLVEAAGGRESYALECAHAYHRECIAGCVRRRMRLCPICRLPMSSAVVRDLRPREGEIEEEEEEEEEGISWLRTRELTWRRRTERLNELLKDRSFMTEARAAEDRLKSSGDVDEFNAFLDRYLST